MRLLAHGLDALLVFLVLRQVRHVAAIDLEVVRRNVLEQLERVESRTELFEGEAAMQLLEATHESTRGLEAGHDLALRHLEYQRVTPLARVFQLQCNPWQQGLVVK